MSKIPLAGLLFLIFNPIVSQFNKAAFEKNYLEFHEKWEAGYDCSLKEIETLFDQCPDLSQYPHYYLYKGDLLSSKGYSDLALKYYLLGEKYNALGYENKKIYDHTPIFYFKLGYNYAMIDAQVDFKKYIDKLKAYVSAEELPLYIQPKLPPYMKYFYYGKDQSVYPLWLVTIFGQKSTEDDSYIVVIKDRTGEIVLTRGKSELY